MSLSRADSVTELSPLKFVLGNELSVLDATPPSPDTVLPFNLDKLSSRSPFPPDTEVSYTIQAPADTGRMYSPIAFFDDNFDFEQQRLAAAAAQHYSRELQGAAEPPAGSIPPAVPVDSPQTPVEGKTASSHKLMPSLPALPAQQQPAPSKKRPRPAPPARPATVDDDDIATTNNDDDDEYDGTDHDAKKRPASKKKKAASGSGAAAGAGSAPRSRNATSVYRGVSRCSKDGRWQARIRCVAALVLELTHAQRGRPDRIRKIVVYLGRYPEEEDAARKYDEAAREHHGSRAVLNFLTEEDIRIGCKSVFGGGVQSEGDE